MTALFGLTEHVALVTGGNSGIGLGMAEALVGQGASVAIWGTNPAKNAAAAQRLRAHGRPVLDLVCDVAAIESITAYGRYWNFDLDADAAPWASNGAGLGEVAHYANGPCAGLGVFDCRFDSRANSRTILPCSIT